MEAVAACCARCVVQGIALDVRFLARAGFPWRVVEVWFAQARSEEREEEAMTDVYELKDAEEHWEEIMERVEAGEEIILAREGKAVARVVPVEDK